MKSAHCVRICTAFYNDYHTQATAAVPLQAEVEFRLGCGPHAASTPECPGMTGLWMAALYVHCADVWWCSLDKGFISSMCSCNCHLYATGNGMPEP
jgi:hypothetical protein